MGPASGACLGHPIRLFVTTLKAELSAKYSTLFEDNNLYVIATYLDPRYKYKFSTTVTEERIKENILKMRHTEDDVSGSFNSEGAKRMRMKFLEKYTQHNQRRPVRSESHA